ncbi:MAG: prepilin peptidase [Candidatus Aenigmarchaeota archaeon]|nr:prepilin peptidase [Candidatus Aenigmarchaeota archaeon]
MVFELLSLAIAFIGSIAAGIWDLKTTDIPDKIPHLMIVAGVAIAVAESVLQSNYWILFSSLISGGSLFAIGFLMYYFGQWGGGDAKILSAIGFLIPSIPSQFPGKTLLPFPVSFLFNVFLIGTVYMISYAIIYALKNRKLLGIFLQDVKGNQKVIYLGSVAIFASFLMLNYFLSAYLLDYFDIQIALTNSVLLLIGTIGIYIIFKFAKIVQDHGFTKKIPISKLKVGDVLLENKLFEGITQKEIKKLKSSGKRFVYVKEGVRFGMAFPLALLFTIYFGDAFLLFIRLL